MNLQPELPLNALMRNVTPLVIVAPDGVIWLAAQSQAAFDAGEQDYRPAIPGEGAGGVRPGARPVAGQWI